MIDEWRLLNRIDRVKNAGWRPEQVCYAGTRQAVLGSILDWANGPHDATTQVLWLCGMAGIGKSAISHSVCQQLTAAYRLGGSFFFSRNIADCRVDIRLFSTLAHTLALKSPSYRKRLCNALERNPAPDDPLNEFVVQPLSESAAPIQPFVIVLDALDECDSLSAAGHFLYSLVQHLPQLVPYLKFFVTSRPNRTVKDSLEGRSLPLEVPLDESNHRDVRLYIDQFMKQTRFNNTSPGWPEDPQRELLAERAGGLFIWASTACLFLRDSHFPSREIIAILNGPDARLHELYDLTIGRALDQATRGGYTNDFRLVLSVMMVLNDPLSPAALDHLLNVDCSLPVIQSLGHILSHGSPADPVRTIHPSLSRYLTDPDSTSPFSVDVPGQNEHLAMKCLNTMHAALSRDICRIETDGLAHTANTEISDLAMRLANRVPTELLYACRFWAQHVLAAPNATSLLPFVQRFYEEDLLCWIEVMSLHGRIGDVIASLRSMSSWHGPLSTPAVPMHAPEPASSRRRPPSRLPTPRGRPLVKVSARNMSAPALTENIAAPRGHSLMRGPVRHLSSSFRIPSSDRPPAQRHISSRSHVSAILLTILSPQD